MHPRLDLFSSARSFVPLVHSSALRINPSRTVGDWMMAETHFLPSFFWRLEDFGGSAFCPFVPGITAELIRKVHQFQKERNIGREIFSVFQGSEQEFIHQPSMEWKIFHIHTALNEKFNIHLLNKPQFLCI